MVASDAASETTSMPSTPASAMTDDTTDLESLIDAELGLGSESCVLDPRDCPRLIAACKQLCANAGVHFTDLDHIPGGSNWIAAGATPTGHR